MQALVLQPNDLDRIVDSLKEQIRSEFKTIATNPEPEKPMHPPEAAKHFGISRATLFNRIKNGEIPPSIVHRNGKSLYFFKSEINEFLKTL